MALPAIDAVCNNCGVRFRGKCSRSFLGFQKLTCPECSQTVLYPLTPGYRKAYWGFIALVVLAAFLEGRGVSGWLLVVAVYALLKDAQMRKTDVVTATQPPKGNLMLILKSIGAAVILLFSVAAVRGVIIYPRDNQTVQEYVSVIYRPIKRDTPAQARVVDGTPRKYPWGAAEFGMTEQEVRSIYGERLRPAPPGEKYHKVYVPFTLPQIPLGHWFFTAHFQFSESTRQVTQVLLRLEEATVDEEMILAVFNYLSEIYGPPVEHEGIVSRFFSANLEVTFLRGLVGSLRDRTKLE